MAVDEIAALINVLYIKKEYTSKILRGRHQIEADIANGETCTVPLRCDAVNLGYKRHDGESKEDPIMTS